MPISGIDDVLLAEEIRWSAISCTFQWGDCKLECCGVWLQWTTGISHGVGQWLSG